MSFPILMVYVAIVFSMSPYATKHGWSIQKRLGFLIGLTISTGLMLYLLI